jgi:hypothetical protein
MVEAVNPDPIEALQKISDFMDMLGVYPASWSGIPRAPFHDGWNAGTAECKEFIWHVLNPFWEAGLVKDNEVGLDEGVIMDQEERK